MEQHVIPLAAEKIGQIGFLPITNTLLVSWIVVLILLVLGFLAGKKPTLIPSGIQNLFEAILDPLFDLTEQMAADKAKAFFPIVTTFFLYILVSNWLGLFPGFGTIGFYEHGEFIPIFRSLNADLNVTLGLGLLSIAITHIFAVKFLGVGGYLKKWFSLNPIFLFVGLLELVGEGTKTLSLSLRLFGNIFAGEVVLSTISNLLAFVAPLPFYLLELIVGLVQAAVFMMLTLVFMVLLSQKHDAH